MSPFLEDVAEFLRLEVRPIANQLDGDPIALDKALRGLCDRGWMALRRPLGFGGPELAEPEFRAFQEEIARASGSLAFLQTQHQSAVSMLSKCENDELKRVYLPRMHDGQVLMGIGFSQLRRPGPPLLRAEPVTGGYVLTGHVPWVTGWTFFGEFLIGATLPDGQAVFGVVPFVNGQGIQFSEPMRLAAMESAQTVTAELDNLFLGDDRVAFIKPAGWIQNNDQINITLQAFFALGCARAGLDILGANALKKPFPFLGEALASLLAELDECRAAIATGEGSEEERLQLRAWAIDLAVRCAHAGVASSSGAANSADHAAQRVYREALVYTVSAQTSAIMEATLSRLTARGRRGAPAPEKP